jgi:hypothetical protein
MWTFTINQIGYPCQPNSHTYILSLTNAPGGYVATRNINIPFNKKVREHKLPDPAISPPTYAPGSMALQLIKYD